MASAEQSCSDGWTRASYFPTATAKLFFSSQILRRRMLRAESEKHDHKMESTISFNFVLTNETFHYIFTFIRCSEVRKCNAYNITSGKQYLPFCL